MFTLQKQISGEMLERKKKHKSQPLLYWIS